MLKIYNVSFFGHRIINDSYSLEMRLKKQIYHLIDTKEFVCFIVGRNGDFDYLVSSTIKCIKKNHRDDNSSLLLVLPYQTSEYKNNQKYFHDYYDDIEICHLSQIAHPKLAFKIRNHEMVDRSDLIISYIEHDYGGAYETIKYAKSKEKSIINLFDENNVI